MRRNYPKRTRRNPAENYDTIYQAIPGRPDVSRIIHHPRKLVIINLVANPWKAEVEEVFYERTCYEDEVI